MMIPLTPCDVEYARRPKTGAYCWGFVKAESIKECFGALCQVAGRRG
jgi:hypothetical protein